MGHHVRSAARGLPCRQREGELGIQQCEARHENLRVEAPFAFVFFAGDDARPGAFRSGSGDGQDAAHRQGCLRFPYAVVKVPDITIAGGAAGYALG